MKFPFPLLMATGLALLMMAVEVPWVEAARRPVQEECDNAGADGDLDLLSDEAILDMVTRSLRGDGRARGALMRDKNRLQRALQRETLADRLEEIWMSAPDARVAEFFEEMLGDTDANTDPEARAALDAALKTELTPGQQAFLSNVRARLDSEERLHGTATTEVEVESWRLIQGPRGGRPN